MDRTTSGTPSRGTVSECGVISIQELMRAVPWAWEFCHLPVSITVIPR